MKKLYEAGGQDRTVLQKIIAGGLPIFCSTLIIAWRFRPVLDNFWVADDTQILKHAIAYRPWEYFFLPKVWHELSASNFTPWLTFSFDLDWNIFGLHPHGFYLHQIISLCIVSGVSYGVLRLWFSRSLSFLGTLLFILSPPFAETAHLLMVRHYVEGMIFALLSLYFYVKAVRNNNMSPALVASLLYLLACSAKEIYWPLPLFLLVLPEGTWRNRVNAVLPCAVISLLFLGWRWFMLGSQAGGYGVALEWPRDVVLFFPRLADALGAGLDAGTLPMWRLVIGSSSVLAVIIFIMYERKYVLRLSLVFALLLLPIVPVSPLMSPRYVWLITFCWTVLHILIWKKVLKSGNPVLVRGAAVLWAIMLIFAFFSASSLHIRNLKTDIDRRSMEGRFFLETGSQTDVLVSPISQAWYLEGLLWLRDVVLHAPKGPAAVYDAYLLCLDDRIASPYDTIWHLNGQGPALVPAGIQNFTAGFCNQDTMDKIRLDAPLSADIDYDTFRITWEFGPYKDGTYAVITGETADAIHLLPPRGKKTGALKSISLRLRYISPDGWMTYSPLLRLDVSGHKGHVAWKR